MNRVPVVVISALAILCSIAPVAQAQAAEASQTSSASRVNAGLPPQDSVPRLVQFSGSLKDAVLRPISGVESVTFTIYAEQDGGTALWSETQNVLADASGHYSVLLGSATANGVPPELFGTGQSRWLGVTIARQPEMARVLLASVPYALKAADADTLGGLPASAYVTAQSLAAASTKPGTFGGATTVIATPEATTALAPSGIPQVTPTGSGTTDFVPIWTSSAVLGNSTIFESAGLVGIGTTSPEETLDVNGNSIFRGSFQLPPGHEATASSGYESHSFQFEASSYNSSTKAASDKAFGFRAEPLGNNTTNPSAKLDLFFGSANSTLTDTGLSFSSAGVITFAPGQTFSSTSGAFNEITLPNTTSSTSGVISIGGQAFLSNSGASTNTFVGGGAGGASEISGSSADNTGVGSGALVSNTSGVNNTAAGASALESATTGSYNTAFGVQALNFEATGGSDSAIGYAAGYSDETGSFNTFIGANADASKSNLTHATAIGAGAIVGESNAIVLGGINPNAVNVGIGTSLPGYTLEVDDHGTAGAAIAGLTDFANHNAIFGSSSGSGSNGGYFVTSDSVGSGVVGVNTGGGKAGYFGGNVEVAGNLQVDGTLVKMGGSFKIDDPIDPAGKYLSHSFVESPDMMNIYNGNVVTDAKGFATVTMPAWFEALNGDFRYQLTTLGRFAQAMVASEIENGQFTIQTDKPNVKVSWMVTGVRHDLWANAHRIPTEEEKPSNEQGRYLHPELYGAGPDKSVAASGYPLQQTPEATVAPNGVR
jgi:hypothetical protein